MTQLQERLADASLTVIEKESLEFLQDAASSKMKLFHMELENMFLNPRTAGKVPIIGDRAVRYQEDYRVDVTEDDIQPIADSIVSFSYGSSDSEKNRFQSLTAQSLKNVLSDTSAGKQETRASYVVLEYNTLVRMDARFWKFNFSQEGVLGNHKNAFCYLVAKSVIDPKKMTLNDLIDLVSDEVSDFSLEDFTSEAQAIWEQAQTLNEDTIYLEYLKSCTRPD